MKRESATTLTVAEDIQRQIHVVRGKRVMLDTDLARFYGVATFNLNKAVSRNRARFPEDFAFQHSVDETRALTFHSGISKPGRGGRRTGAWVFTEQGVAMLASVLRSDRAVTVSIAIVRAFVQLRELLATHGALSTKLADLERRIEGHDETITNLFEAIRQLIASPDPDHKRRIGFNADGP